MGRQYRYEGRRMMTWRERIIDWAVARKPDFIIGGEVDPYLIRWFLIPRNPVFNIYVHLFLRSDDDRALHDHPWPNLSILLDGKYREHLKDGFQDLQSGNWRFRLSGTIAHRIELTDGPCWTLFITGPRYRSWFFHCPQGLIHWRLFTAQNDSGLIGKGCDQ
jgi:hypothetical protein